MVQENLPEDFFISSERDMGRDPLSLSFTDLLKKTTITTPNQNGLNQTDKRWKRKILLDGAVLCGNALERRCNADRTYPPYLPPPATSGVYHTPGRWPPVYVKI